MHTNLPDYYFVYTNWVSKYVDYDILIHKKNNSNRGKVKEGHKKVNYEKN